MMLIKEKQIILSVFLARRPRCPRLYRLAVPLSLPSPVLPPSLKPPPRLRLRALRLARFLVILRVECVLYKG